MLFACTLVQLGKRAEALDALDRVVEAHGLVWLPWLQGAPCFRRGLAGEPRYENVIARVQERQKELRDRLPATLSAHGVADVTSGGGP